MAARIKRVVDAGMVAHLWAHKAQDEAREKGGGKFYFDGDTIYSYGDHFPIARHVSNRRGESAVLLTTRTYSSTTAGHVLCVRGACRHLTVFNVTHPRNEGATARRKDFEGYRKRQVELMQEYAKARSQKPSYFAQMNSVVREANAFAAFFGLRTRLKIPADAEAMEAECERVAKAESARQAKAMTLRKKQEAERLAKMQVYLDEWVAGADRRDYFGGLPVRLRIHDGELQTSLGASVSLAEAKRVFKILRKLRKRGEKYQRNGETIKLGPFELDSMDESGTVKVGCHTVAWEECERVAVLAGVK